MASRLVVVCGNAGTGKTTWAKQLTTHYQAALLDLDTVSEKLVTAAQLELGRDPGDRDSPDYKRVYRQAIHDTLFGIARDSAAPLVIVAPFTQERSRPDFREWLRESVGRSAEVHYFVCEPAVREARLRARSHPRDGAKLRDYEQYRALGPDESRPPYEHTWFDTTDSFPDLAALFGTPQRASAEPDTP